MKKSFLNLLFTILLLAFTSFAQANLNQPIPNDPNVKIGKLPNGLTYYIRKNAKPENKVELRLAINAGAVLERDDQQGLAHFMEHMNFNGTKNFKKNELVSYLQSIGVDFGADLNAYTDYDETVYILPIPTEKKELLDKGLLVLSDWASGTLLDQTEIDKERGVVLEELRLGKGASQRMRDKYLPRLMQGSQYALRNVIGTKEILQNFNRKSLVDFYETWYRPDLMAVIAVGDLNINEMEAKIKAQFSGIKAKRKAVKRPSFPIPDTKGTMVAIETDKEAQITSAELLYKKPKTTETTLADLRQDLIREFFDNMFNSRIDEIRQAPNSPFFQAGGGFSSFFREKSSYSMSGITSPSSVKATLSALLTENRRVREFGFTKAEFDRLKERYLNRLESRLKEKDKSESYIFAEDYVNSFLNKEVPTGIEFDYQFAKSVIPTITLEEINALAKNTTSDDNRAIIITGLAKDGVTYPTEKEILQLLDDAKTTKVTPYAETVTSEPLVKDLTTTVSVTDEKADNKFGLTYWTLSNGIKVVLKPTDFKADEITMRAFSPGGFSLVSDDKYKTSFLLGQVIGESGVKNLSKVELGKMMAGKRANASVNVGELYEYVSGTATPKDFETMLQMAYLKFTNVNFDKAVFDSFIGRQKMFLPTLAANPQFYFSQEVQKVLSQGNPRAVNPFDEKTLDGASLEDIKAVYKDRFADASDFTFVFVGNFKSDDVKPLIIKYLGNLPTIKRTENWKDVSVKPPTGKIEKVVNKGVDDKSVVQILFTGETKYDLVEDRNLNALGELLTIKLLEILREEKGGVYGVGANGGMSKLPNGKYSFSISFPCGPENVDSLIKAAFGELAKIQNGQIDDKDIVKVKEAQLVKVKENYKLNSFWMSSINSNLQQGDELLTLEESEVRINSINKEDIQKVGKKYLKEDQKLQFVLMPEKK
jgi:zinc protease